MGLELATGRNGTATAGVFGWADPADRPGLAGAESTGTAVGVRVTGDRILIRPDADEEAPRQTEGGILLARTLASAVEGSDAHPSWCTGVVLQAGPLVGWRDVRRQIAGWLLALEAEGHDLAVSEITRVRHRVETMSADNPDPVRIGQRVVFSWQAGHQVAVDGEPYIVIRASDVLAIVEG